MDNLERAFQNECHILVDHSTLWQHNENVLLFSEKLYAIFHMILEHCDLKIQVVNNFLTESCFQDEKNIHLAYDRIKMILERILEFEL